jgi:hypothetical protein
MLRTRLVRSFATLASVVLIASCSDAIITSPNAPVEALAAKNSGPANSTSPLGAATDAAGLELKAVWWKKQHKTLVRVSKTIDAAGGVISIPETGLTMEFPAGAVTRAVTITVTADEKYVAYKMEPAGTQFQKDVTVTQSLLTTAIFGQPLRSQLYAAYIADDNVKLSGSKVPVIEIEPSRTIFSTLSPLLPQAQVWIIRHFSRYMLASG